MLKFLVRNMLKCRWNIAAKNIKEKILITILHFFIFNMKLYFNWDLAYDKNVLT